MKSVLHSRKFRLVVRFLVAAFITAALAKFCHWCLPGEENAAYLSLGLLCSALTGILIALPVRFPRIVSGILYVILPIAAFFLMESLTHSPMTIRVSVLPLEFIFFYLLYSLLFFLTGRMSLGFCLANVIVLFIGVANYYILEFRSSPILPWDLSSFFVAASVADNFTFNGSLSLMLSVLGFGFCSALAEKCSLRLRSWKPVLAGSAATLFLLFGYTAAIQTDSVGDWFNIYEMPFTQGYTYKMNGFFVSFLVNAKYLKVDVPEDYSDEAAATLLEESAGDDSGQVPADEDRPNIIVIMNEAFSDLSVLGDFTASEDYMPYLRSMMGSEDTISGSLHVSVLGGNTANTEFEFLTGSSMAFLPTGSVAYQQFIQEDTPSLARVLKELGYETVAMHPYGASGWNRNTVYPHLGFDRALFRQDFTRARLLRGYVSDASNYQQLIKEFEAKEDGTPIFLFDVTMQNHGSYTKQYNNFTPSITVRDPDLGELPKTEMYLSLIREADKALEELITYFENVDENTIVVFFGDHQPTLLESSFFKALFGKSTDNLNTEELASRYEVPFLIWANYDIEEDKNLNLSANYLSSLVMEAAGLPKTNYMEYLDAVREQVPVLTANFYRDNVGNLYTHAETSTVSELLDEYAIVQYNQLFDTKNRLWESYLP